MDLEKYAPTRVVYILLGLAAFIIIVAGIKAAESIIVPFLLALFFTFILFPVIIWSKMRSIPPWLSILLMVLVIVKIFVFFIFVVGSNIQSLAGNIPEYHDLLEQRWQATHEFWQARGIDMSAFKISDLISSNVIKDVAVESLGSLTTIAEDSFLVFVLMIFMLIASTTFPSKIAALSSDKKSTLFMLDKIIHLISHYMMIKTVISLITGFFVTILLVILGIDHAVFWGFLAFVLNYIPNVGSFLAAIPVVLLALLQSGFEMALYVTLVYVLINVVMGNFIEPRAMGKSTELSVVVIFLSLIFWGWILGPVGMFLSVPLTIVMKIVFEHFNSTHWLSILLGPDNLSVDNIPDKSDEGIAEEQLPAEESA